MADNSLQRVNGRSNESTYDHRWGFKDTRFVLLPNGAVKLTGQRYALSGSELPDFIPFVEETLGIQLDLSDVKQEQGQKPIAAARRNEPFLQALADRFAPEQLTTDNRQRLIHSHGQTTADEVYKVLYGELQRVADLVFWPQAQQDICDIIALAVDHDVCLVPYGGGTSVSGALKLPESEARMIVVIDTRRMNHILWIDRENLRACAEAGITGSQLEEALNREGFTSGHEPDSIELSTLGGWIATNASGMKKNRYGNIEDIVENLTMVTPRGVIEQHQLQPRVSMGMQPQALLFGSEGTLGIITQAVLRIHKLPDVKKYGSFVFRDFEIGVKFLRALTRTGQLPASIRLLDNVQFRFGSALKPRSGAFDKAINVAQKTFLLKVKQFDPMQLVVATVVMEGAKEEVAYQEKQISELARQHGGISGGENNGKRGYMLTYAIAYIRDFLAEYHILGETYETTVPWSRVLAVCEAVNRRALELHAEYGLPGRPYVSPRVTQLYHSGVCIYFTHGFCSKGISQPEEVFAVMERELRRTIMEAGGSISHHHGVGKIRQEFVEQTMSPAALALLHEIKQAQDPKNIFGIGNNVFGAERQPQAVK